MRIHIVRKGDTLWLISQKYNVPLQEIIEANPQIIDPDNLQVGDKVRIPTRKLPQMPEWPYPNIPIVPGFPWQNEPKQQPEEPFHPYLPPFNPNLPSPDLPPTPSEANLGSDLGQSNQPYMQYPYLENPYMQQPQQQQPYMQYPYMQYPYMQYPYMQYPYMQNPYRYPMMPYDPCRSFYPHAEPLNENFSDNNDLTREYDKEK